MSQAPTTQTLGDIAVVLGTRPEIIKLAGVIQALGERARVVHTGQHWDDSMAGQFFRSLGLGDPDTTLSSVGGQSRGLQIGRGIAELTEHFLEHPVRAVVVQGDTNSTTIGAQTASYLGVPVVHVEAGLRSFDRNMPEELNRLVVGAVADLHCAATPENASNLYAEGVDPARVVVTGNTVVEATQLARLQPHRPVSDMVSVSARWSGYLLATIHRPENTDDAPALERIMMALAATEKPVVFTLHPRTAAALRRHGLEHLLETPQFEVLTGVGHADFLELASHADLIVSDSGGVQEEVTVLKKPLLVVRRSTERPESVSAGFSRLVTPDDDLRAEIIAELAASHEDLERTPSPYGGGTASTEIARRTIDLADSGGAVVEPVLQAQPDVSAKSIATLTSVVARSLTAEAAAKQLGVAPATVHEWEIGMVNAVTHRRMVNQLGVPVSQVPTPGLSLYASTDTRISSGVPEATVRLSVSNELEEPLKHLSIECVSFTNAAMYPVCFREYLTQSTGEAGALAPGATRVYEAEYAITQADIDAGGPLVSSFIAQGVSSRGEVVLAQEDAWIETDRVSFANDSLA